MKCYGVSAGKIYSTAENDYDEAQHPRDENGRWTSGGGGGRSSPAGSGSRDRTVLGVEVGQAYRGEIEKHLRAMGAKILSAEYRGGSTIWRVHASFPKGTAPRDVQQHIWGKWPMIQASVWAPEAPRSGGGRPSSAERGMLDYYRRRRG